MRPVSTLDELADWLLSRDADEIETILRLRDDALRGAPPLTMHDLAERLVHRASVGRSIAALPEPALQVLEVLTACGSGAGLARAAELLDHAGDLDSHLADVAHWVDLLLSAALVWQLPAGVAGEHRSAGGVRVNPGVPAVLPVPLGLGRPASVVLAEVSATELAKVTRRWGLDVPKRKADQVAAVSAVLADGALVREMVGGAPEDVRRVLLDRAADAVRVAAAGARAGDEDLRRHLAAQGLFGARVASQWAKESGLAFTDPYGGEAELPAEVLLALADGSFRAPFTPRPPLVPTAAVAAQQVATSAAGAATTFLAAAMATLEHLSRHPVATVRAGGVGARELTRLAKALGADVAELRLVLECAGSSGLLEVDDGAVSTSEVFARWRRRAPEVRAAHLLRRWSELPGAPTVDRDEEGASLPALAAPVRGNADAAARSVLLTWLAGLGDDVGAVGVEPLVDAVAWRLPLVVGGRAGVAVRAAWDEAERLGVIAHGRLSAAGLTLLGAGLPGAGDAVGTGARRGGAVDDPDVPSGPGRPAVAGDPLVAELARMLPAVQRNVRIGSDHTVVVSGTPDVAVVDLLDALAVREARGAASVWRLTPASVRDALDGGYLATDLLAALRDLAGGSVPQAVEYLLRDVERRHGRVGVRPAGSVLVSQDEALLAEVAADRRLRSLRLSALAPTVLVAASSSDAVLSALRAAGYLPVEQDVAGARVVQVRAVPGLGGGGEPPGFGARHAVDAEERPERGREPSLEREPESVPEPDTPEAALRRWAQADAARGVGEPVAEPVAETPAEVAQRLLRREPAPAGDALAPTERQIAAETSRLTRAEVRQLAYAIGHGLPVRIRYRSSSGGTTDRVVSDLRLQNGYLWGWCHLRGAERYFLVSSILAVIALG